MPLFLRARSTFRVPRVQHFSCSLKTVECGQIFFLACWQLQKNVSIFSLNNFKIYLMYLPQYVSHCIFILAVSNRT